VSAFLIGLAVSFVAAVPAFLLARGGQGSNMKQRLKLWLVGLLARFAIIGIALLILFTQTPIARVPAVIGVVVAYVISYSLETVISLRA
jgi:xanthine/uracil permease